MVRVRVWVRATVMVMIRPDSSPVQDGQGEG